MVTSLSLKVIRYQLGGTPLLVSSEGVPGEGEIPHCRCGAKRVFELQVSEKFNSVG